MDKSIRNMVLFNLAGAAVIGTVIYSVVHSFFVADQVALCSTRYPSSTELALQSRNGELLSTVEFDSNLGSYGVNVVENVDLQSSSTAPTPSVIRVRLEQHNDSKLYGAGFEWAPSNFSSVSSACLTYSVYVPERVGLKNAGVLPGFSAEGTRVSSEGNDTAADENVVAKIAPRWSTNGTLRLENRLETTDGDFLRELSTVWSTDQSMPLDKWVQVEQEIVLNSAGKPNGTIRFWLDGQMLVEKNNVNWLQNGKIKLSAVDASIGHFGLSQEKPSSPVYATVTPPEVRWQSKN